MVAIISKLDRPNFVPPILLLDSVSSKDKRPASFKMRYPKMVHGDFMTHRVFSRNASSSRAIPNKRLTLTTEEDMYLPEFRLDRPGMQPGEYLDPDMQGLAQHIWKDAADYCISASRKLSGLKVGKQWANRMIEWFGYINVIVTATDFDNFIGLREELTEDMWPMAQDEIYFQADAIKLLLRNHEPTLLREGEWHLPMTRPGEFVDLPLEHRLRIDAARCAGISYETVMGDPMTVETADRICNKLLTARRVHASPFEHQCSPDPDNKRPDLHGNFDGWIQHRKMIPNECIKRTTP